MPTPRDIRRRIAAVKNNAKITQAMRMVAASKLRRAQEKIWSNRPYTEKLELVLSNMISAVAEDYTSPLIELRSDIKNVAAIVVASDKGLCGSFNANVLKFAHNYIKDEFLSKGLDVQVTLITVGRKSFAYFNKTNLYILKNYSGVFQKLEFSTAKDITTLITEKYLNNEFDEVLIFFNEFKNLLNQVPKVKKLLPIEPAQVEEEKDDSKINLHYIFEPNKELILDTLLPLQLDVQTWGALLESNAAQQAAQMMAMENATNNANELVKYLELAYNKVRQASITTEMLEIVSGAEAMQKS
ncbi:MAG: ATP synthase F1 subunit gamma [Ignavibacteria bacterium]|jgi:F-type H+-transporting ATPase subunit gamma|nr:ATP synthase F1 subunit gamma [Ignavibacteria bacterium]